MPLGIDTTEIDAISVQYGLILIITQMYILLIHARRRNFVETVMVLALALAFMRGYLSYLPFFIVGRLMFGICTLQLIRVIFDI